MWVYHYVSGVLEYIIITENEDFDIDANCKPGYEMVDKYEFEGDTGSLPVDYVLQK